MKMNCQALKCFSLAVLAGFLMVTPGFAQLIVDTGTAAPDDSKAIVRVKVESDDTLLMWRRYNWNSTHVRQINLGQTFLVSGGDFTADAFVFRIGATDQANLTAAYGKAFTLSIYEVDTEVTPIAGIPIDGTIQQFHGNLTSDFGANDYLTLSLKTPFAGKADTLYGVLLSFDQEASNQGIQLIVGKSPNLYPDGNTFQQANIIGSRDLEYGYISGKQLDFTVLGEVEAVPEPKLAHLLLGGLCCAAAALAIRRRKVID